MHTAPVNPLRRMLLRDTIHAIAARRVSSKRRAEAFARSRDEAESYAEPESRKHRM